MTTTTTTTPTTTSTTTTPSLLSRVETLVFVEVGGALVEQVGSDASDNDSTVKNLFAKSLNFGTIAPGETSENLIISLNVPNSEGIGNIQIGLIDSGGIEFANNIFGIASSTQLNNNIAPSEFFQGVNTYGLSNNSSNISVENRKSNASEYVYLTLSLPSGNTIGEGVIRFKWFFDFSS